MESLENLINQKEELEKELDIINTKINTINFENKAKQNFTKRLEEYKLTTTNWCNIMSFVYAFGGMIAGSFALFSYLDSDLKENDLDIWFSLGEDKYLDCKRILENYLYNLEYYPGTNNNSFKGQVCVQEDEDLKANRYLENNRINKIIHKIYSYTNKKLNKTIQIIFAKVDHISILKSFDLSFCAVGYDGYKFLVLYEKLTREKKGFLLNYAETTREKNRIQKYIKRGFEINFNIWADLLDQN